MHLTKHKLQTPRAIQFSATQRIVPLTVTLGAVSSYTVQSARVCTSSGAVYIQGVHFHRLPEHGSFITYKARILGGHCDSSNDKRDALYFPIGGGGTTMSQTMSDSQTAVSRVHGGLKALLQLHSLKKQRNNTGKHKRKGRSGNECLECPYCRTTTENIQS